MTIPITDYVLAAQEASTYMTVTNSSTEYTSGTYPPAPLGNVDLIVSWDGTSRISVMYLYDGRHANRRRVGVIPAGAAGDPRKIVIPLAVDNPRATVLCVMDAANSDVDHRLGLRMISSRIDF